MYLGLNIKFNTLKGHFIILQFIDPFWLLLNFQISSLQSVINHCDRSNTILYLLLSINFMGNYLPDKNRTGENAS